MPPKSTIESFLRLQPPSEPYFEPPLFISLCRQSVNQNVRHPVSIQACTKTRKAMTKTQTSKTHISDPLGVWNTLTPKKLRPTRCIENSDPIILLIRDKKLAHEPGDNRVCLCCSYHILWFATEQNRLTATCNLLVLHKKETIISNVASRADALPVPFLTNLKK